MIKAYPKSLHVGHPLDREWLQLLLIVVVGCILPPALWYGFDLDPLRTPMGSNTLYASFVAAICSWYGMAQLQYFANSRRLTFVLPVCFSCFAVVTAVIIFARLPYSNTVLILNSIATIFTAFCIAVVTRDSQARRWLVPGGAIDKVSAELQPADFLTPAMARDLLAARPGTQGSVIADLHFSQEPEWEELLAELAIHSVPVYHYRTVLELKTGQVHIDHMRENDLGSLIPNLAYIGIKRMGDLLLALILLPVLIPLFLIIAVIVRLDTHGRAIFTQKRVGYRGKLFTIYKFRTMIDREVEDSTEARITDAITQDNDRRITRVGRFMRKTRLDELPQVINIIRGEMSWIGPRPEAQSLSELYKAEIPFYRYRHIVRPGITGWAQVNQGHVASIADITHKLRYDFYYVRNVSLWLDILILLKSFRVVLGGHGAK